MITDQPKPEWGPLPREGCVNVEGRVFLVDENLTVANLRFGNDATIDPHPADWNIDVVCLSGSGFTRIGDETYELNAGQRVRWPAGIEHCLWTENSEMETLMIERYGNS